MTQETYWDGGEDDEKKGVFLVDELEALSIANATSKKPKEGDKGAKMLMIAKTTQDCLLVQAEANQQCVAGEMMEVLKKMNAEIAMVRRIQTNTLGFVFATALTEAKEYWTLPKAMARERAMVLATELRELVRNSSNATKGQGAAAEEFADLQKAFPLVLPKEQCSIALSPENKLLNRYGNVLPPNTALLESEKYINASFMDLFGVRWIATQWPVNVEDVWECMFFKYGVRCIVALQNPDRKHLEYYPTNQQTKVYGAVEVKHTGTNVFSKSKESKEVLFVVHKFTMTKPNVKGEKETKSLSIVVYTAWPDHGLPEEPQGLHTLFKTLPALNLTATMNREIPPTVVHCSAGIGRTGVFIALATLINNKWGKSMTKQIVSLIRQHRPGAVQTAAQYSYIHQFIDQYNESNGITAL